MRFFSLVNRLAVMQSRSAAIAKSLLKKALVLIAGFSALCGFAGGETLVDVQIYENTIAFPGESRFFMTARDADKNYLAANPQMGWVKLDTFTAFAVDQNSPNLGGVCRFYLPSLATHFFTANSAECEQFKADPLFKFEGVDFAVMRPVAGTCGAALTPVVRYYNDGFTRGVSGNHFYGTGTNAGIGNYLARFAGWRNEGAVMCVPNQAKSTAQVIIAGRGNALEPQGATIAAMGSPIAQILNSDSLQSKSYADILGGDSDWLARTAFDELRGKLYLVRAATILVPNVVSNSFALQSSPLLSSVLTVRPTRNTKNVLEIDVASGAMRYLDIGGTFTDVHYNAERRLLLLASVGTNEAATLTWFDPVRNAVANSSTVVGVSYDASVQHIGMGMCEYLLEQTTFVATPSFLVANFSRRSTFSCVDSGGIVRALPANFPVYALGKNRGRACTVGDTLVADFRRLNLNNLTLLPDLPKVSFGAVAIPSQPGYDSVGCFASGNSLYAVISAHYANLTRGYFVVEYRDGVAVNSVGPLTESVNNFPNSILSSFEGAPPGFLNASDASFVKRGASTTTELWALTPQYVETVNRVRLPPRDVLQRLNATTFKLIGEINLVVPSQTLHLSTR